MNITIIATETSSPEGKNYKVAEVTYKGADGKVASKKVMSFIVKSGFEFLENASKGDEFEIETVKNGKGYWDWVNVSRPGESAPTAKPTPNAPKTAPVESKGFNTYQRDFESKEERQARQVLIVRQSSLSTAVAALKTDKKTPTSTEVIDYAKELEAYVMGTDKPAIKQLIDMPDDVPEVEQEDIGF